MSESYSCASGGVISAGRFQSPAWARNAITNTWIAVPTINKLSDLDPAKNPLINPVYPAQPEWDGVEGQSAVIADWCGACYDRVSDVYHIPLSGGHNGYGGNEPYKIALTNAPTWVMQRPPTGAIGNQIITHDGTDATAVFSDNRPKAVHTYNTLVYVPGRGPMLTVHGSATSYNAAGNDARPILVDENTGEPTYYTNNPYSVLTAGGERGGSCYDASRDCLWYLSSRNWSILTKFSFLTNTWSQIGSNLNCDSNSACYLQEDDCILFLSIAFPSGIAVFDCITSTWHYPSTSGSCAGGVNLMTTLYGSVAPTWVPAIGVAAFWDNTSDTTAINILTKPANPRTGTWAISQLPVSGSNTVTPTVKAAAGTYGRFQYSPNLKGFFLINGTTQSLYFYKLGQ